MRWDLNNLVGVANSFELSVETKGGILLCLDLTSFVSILARHEGGSSPCGRVFVRCKDVGVVLG